MTRHDRRFRFGVQVRGASSRDEWLTRCASVEELGYDTLTLLDHFGHQFAPVPALAAAAVSTRRLRIGSLVFDNDFRHPVVLAKEAATLDVLSNGRLQFGLGAGWEIADYEWSGIPYDRPGVRIDRMVEALRIIRGLWAGGPCTIEGEHYAVRDMEGHPKPVQSPRPPILIGGGGRRLLTIAAREADIVSINPTLRSGRIESDVMADVTAEQLLRKVGWVREVAGDRFEALELHRSVFLCKVANREAAAPHVARSLHVSTGELLDMPSILLGTEQEIVDQLQRLRDGYGISYVTVRGPQLREFAPVVERLAGR